MSQEEDVPASQVPAAVFLQQDGRRADLAISDPLQPAPDRLLDLDAGRAEPVGPQLLQVRHLAGSEEDLCLPELEHVGLLMDRRTEIAVVRKGLKLASSSRMTRSQ